MPHVPPPVIALGAAGVQRILRPHRPGSSTGSLRKGAVVAFAGTGLALMGTSARRFFAAGTTVDPRDPSKATTLVTDGPNAFTRNPMYLGLTGLLTAHALARGGLAPWLPVAGFVAVIDRLQIRPEEAALRDRFGPAYDDYCRRVRRWV